jgi:putative ABC transport system permease protein
MILRARLLIIAVRRGGARAGLAVSAVALAIAAMMLVLALSAGADRELREISEKTGRNLIGISPVDATSPRGLYRSPRLKSEDVVALREQVWGVSAIVPVREGSLRASYQGLSLTTSVLGVTPAYVPVRNFRIEEGRALDEHDGAARARVAVVGAFVARRLNGGYSMVGETIWIGRVPFEIVGQLAAKGLSGEGSNEDDQILIPLETALRRLFNSDSLSRLLVQFASERQLGLARTSAREVLRASHELDEEARDDFRILSLVRQNEIRRRSSEFLQGLAATFAAVTLAVGAAGVLAVTFLNVKERIPEIGLRMAIGARPRDITRLFVAEACLLSAMGGLAGLLLGSLGIVLLARFLSWTMAVDLRGVAFPFAVSVMLGVTCSLIPAIRAASVMPVEALRDR